MLRAYTDGQVRVEHQWVWELGGHRTPDWPYGDDAWSIRIVGDPNLHTRIDASATFDPQQPEVLMTAVHAVNAMHVGVEAKPGICTHLDLPLFSRGFFALQSLPPAMLPAPSGRPLTRDLGPARVHSSLPIGIALGFQRCTFHVPSNGSITTRDTRRRHY